VTPSVARRTIFNTPAVRTMFHWLGRLSAQLTGWTVVGQPPAAKKYVMVGCPHTSNWDFLVLLMAIFSLRMELYWIGKHTLFPTGLGWFVRWLGGVPVNRGKQAGRQAKQIAAAYQSVDELGIMIAPEGTRGKVDKWKTGFYHIAHEAGVPIVLAFMDYGTKRVGIGPSVIPNGDMEQQLPEIQAFYEGMTGKNS